jgi:transposase
MDKYELIRTAHRVYGQSIVEVSEMTGHSRNTVRKALHGEPWGYKERAHQAFPVLEPYLPLIDDWLKEDKKQPKKQRHTARRIYHRLVAEQGFTGAESTVRRYVRLIKAKLGINRPGAFVPCDPEAGHEGEADWGTATAILAGEAIQLKFFCMRSKYSGKPFVRFYPCERQQAFLDGHVHAFAFYGGVFPVLIYDNLTVAVRKVFQGRDRLEQDGFVRFKAYYSFESRFCNPDSGNGKGGVEGLVGFARRNYMVPVPEAASIEELNERLLVQCATYGNHTVAGRERTVAELFEEEKSHLLKLPAAVFCNVLPHDGRIDKYSTVTVDKNRYSVPSEYVGFKSKALLHVDRIELFTDGRKIAVHERLYGNNKWSLNPDHYLELLKERPMAFHSARPIRQWREKWPECLHRLLARFCDAHCATKGIKEFVTVLMLYRQHKASDVATAAELALENDISSSEGVRHLLEYSHKTDAVIPPLADWPTLPPPDVSVYGQLGGVL